MNPDEKVYDAVPVRMDLGYQLDESGLGVKSIGGLFLYRLPKFPSAGGAEAFALDKEDEEFLAAMYPKYLNRMIEKVGTAPVPAR